jgi:pimeloyl-ACP methyl ester carboxylesterase
VSLRRGFNPAKRLIIFAAVSILCIQPAPAQNTETNAGHADKSPHKSGFVTANGVRLHYLDWGGTGSVLLLLTGYGDDAHVFDDFAPKFTDHFHVIGLTRRGFGESDKPSTGYDIATRVEDIRQFLDALKIGRVSIIGHSMAGDEMTTFATLYPRRVRRLVYLEAAYNRTRLFDIVLTDPGLPPVWKRLNLEAEGSPEASNVVVKDMPPPEVWKIYKAVTKAMSTFRPDYTKVKAPALAFYATPEHYPSIPTQADEATRRKWDEWWVKNFIPFQRASVEQFRREAPCGQVVEMKEATHYIFRGRTADEVVRRTREFLCTLRK